MSAPTCGSCHRCAEIETAGMTPLEQLSYNSRMILCGTCRCKRCPQASDHRLECTASNESGQPGSVYR